MGEKSVKKMLQKIDLDISCGASKFSRILWLKNTKKETQLKKILKKKANQDTPIIEKRKKKV